MKLLGVQNGGKQPLKTGTGTPFNPDGNKDFTAAEAATQGKERSVVDNNELEPPPRAYNAAAAMLERHDKIVNKVKAGH